MTIKMFRCDAPDCGAEMPEAARHWLVLSPDFARLFRRRTAAALDICPRCAAALADWLGTGPGNVTNVAR